MGAESLDEEDVPALTTGQAADLLGVQPAFLRSLDAGRMLRPHRSTGGHRRWSRRQLALAARLRVLFDEGLTLTAAWMVVTLQDEVAAITQERDRVQAELERTRRDLGRARREFGTTRSELTAREGSTVRAHRAPGARSAHASPSTPTDSTTP
jgi:DNA-binding transcriptional MerR regulator